MDQIIRIRTPGEPLHQVEDVSEEMGEGCLLVSSGIPDFVLVPDEFGHGNIVPGVNGEDRCDVNGVYDAPKWSPPCPSCGTTTSYVRVWYVTHRNTETEFLLFECRCGILGWGLRPVPDETESE